ncbi:MAG TPA: exonuclease SbcCD subunit D, partial [Thermoplasmatales archaeon]|nr:exonuclease SbcCD subunit D [Thermoplasmatales archaeon]
MTLKIVHLADTHLGFSAYRKITKDGLNQREVDVYNAFGRAVDKILEIKPDLIIHAGDLFDSVRPNNRA